MFIRVSDVDGNRHVRYLMQTLLRIHGFQFKSRYGHTLCENIYKVSLRGRRIIVYHTAENERGVFRTNAIWTRINVPVDPEGNRIIVHIHASSWPPTQEL